MRVLILSAAMAALLIAPAMGANTGSDKMKACAAQWNAMPADQKKATTYQKFSSGCMSGRAAMTPQARMSACAAQWQKMKAANKTNGQTYQHFTSQCAKKG
jgi:gas vesicle protein